MNVTDRQKAYLQINEDAESVLSVIEEFAGVLPFDDKASQDVKEGKIEIRDRRIYKKEY